MESKLSNIFSGIKYSVPVVLDRQRKSTRQILKELNYLKRSNSIKDLRFYFFSLMHLKRSGNIDDYANDRELRKITNLLKNNQGVQQDWTLIDDKVKFTKHMIQNEVSIPRFLGSIESGNIYDTNANLIANLAKKEDVDKVFKTWLKDHKAIFIKQNISSHGKAVWKITKEKFDLSFINSENNYLIQEGVEQHPELKKINPNCVNTLRVITNLDNGEEPIIFSSMLRSGVGDSYIDNKVGKFIFIDYDLFSNKMDAIANSQFPKYGSFSKHPVTKFNFENATLPYPDKIIDLVTKAAKAYPKRKIIGWDIAYTEKGPVIIEGNTKPGLKTVQVCLKGIKTNQKYKEMINNSYKK